MLVGRYKVRRFSGGIMSRHTILLVDDSATVRLATAHFIEQLGYECVIATNGVEALDYCRDRRPDLILMDVSMPEMDGLQATVQLRELFGDDWVPIIFLTCFDGMDDVVAALRVGGDDYLLKPVNVDLLSAKINAFLRIVEMQKQISQDALRLTKYYEDNEFEQELALDVLQRLSRRSSLSRPHIWHHLRPAESFSGDFICRSVLPSGVEHFLLADCTGHGLTAAISALPAIDSFHELGPRYQSTGLLAGGINKKLHSLLPTGRFIAAALITINYLTQNLSIWNGGIPCALLYSASGELKADLHSHQPPLGIFNEEQFNATVDQYSSSWQNGDVLVLSSDGITEANNAQGHMFGLDGIKTAVLRGWPDRIGESVLEALNSHVRGMTIRDDVSLLVIRLGDTTICN